MARPANNLEEHIRIMMSGGGASGSGSGSGSATAGGATAACASSREGAAPPATKFRPAQGPLQSFQRHASTGAARLSVGAVEKARTQSPASARSAAASASSPQIPSKRASSPISDSDDDAAPLRAQRAKRVASRASLESSRAAAATASAGNSGKTPQADDRPPSQEQPPSQPCSTASASSSSGLEAQSTEALEARLAELRENREVVMDKLVEWLEHKIGGAVQGELLKMQRSFLQSQIAETRKLLEARLSDRPRISASPADALASRTLPMSMAQVNEIPTRQPLADLAGTISTNANHANEGKGTAGRAASPYVAARQFPQASTSAAKLRPEPEDAILIDDSPPNSPAPPAPAQSNHVGTGSDDNSAVLSERAAGKRRAEEDVDADFDFDFDVDDDDFVLDSSSKAAVMRRYTDGVVSGQHTNTTPQMSHPWSKDLYNALRGTFKLKEFRQNQLEAMNATLSGQDVFCLMPTGGGKSLCYQLPALLNSGKTRGVTVVISPLLSLIHDQVESLMAKDIPALALTGEQTKDVRDFVMAELCQPVPPVKLLYVTPEFVTKSGRAREIFGLLHRRQQLARFVIDEAHCVSQWGHDFRPDYKELGILRRECPGIPIMAMTATANHRVETDVLNNLGIAGCVQLKQSFNRANLFYQVRPKNKDCLSDIALVIRTHFAEQCGIIYCLSRAACEDVAHKLSTNFDVEARHYHAGLNKKERMTVQRKWQQGEFKVIVATIAFGMGIDKSDVRFVIHHTLPSSLEGYYQETGRAGRDGMASTCILYFAYKDSSSIQRLIEKGEGTWAQKEQRRTNLHQVISYCMNKTDCRRVQVLHYFGEIFPRENCHHSCDNCKADRGVTKTVDVTDQAKSVVRLVKKISKPAPGQGATMLHCVEVFRGISKKAIRDRGHDECDEFGKGASLSRGDAERLFQLLLVERILGERSEVNAMGFANAYMQLGPQASAFLRGDKKLSMQVAENTAPAAGSVAVSRRQALGVATRKQQPHLALATEPDPYDLTNFDFDGGADTSAAQAESSVAAGTRQSRQQALKKAVAPARKAAKQASAPRTSGGSLRMVDAETAAKCLAQLRTVRKELAQANGISEATLAEDRLLQALATATPRTMQEMLAVDGFDQDKASFIGPELLSVCTHFAKQAGTRNGDAATTQQQRAGNEHFLSQFRYADDNASPTSGSRSASTSGGGSKRTASSAASKNSKKAAASSTSSSSSSAIRPLGVSRSGGSSAAGPGKRSRAF